MEGSVYDQLQSEQGDYQTYLDRGKSAMDNYDMEKITHDGLDQAYKQGKNLAKQMAGEAMGEKTVQALEMGGMAAPAVYRVGQLARSQYTAGSSRRAYENLTGKKFNLKQARLRRAGRQPPEGRAEEPRADPEFGADIEPGAEPQYKVGEVGQEQEGFDEDFLPEDEETRIARHNAGQARQEAEGGANPEEGREGAEPTAEEADPEGAVSADLQARLDALRDAQPSARLPEEPEEPYEETGGMKLDEFGLPEVEAAPRLPAQEPLGAPEDIGARATRTMGRAETEFARMDKALAGGRETRARAAELRGRTELPDEPPIEREALQGKPGRRMAAGEEEPSPWAEGEGRSLYHEEGFTPSRPMAPGEDLTQMSQPWREAPARATFGPEEGGQEMTDISSIRGPQAPIEATRGVEQPIGARPGETDVAARERQFGQQEQEMQGQRETRQATQYQGEQAARQETMVKEGYKPGAAGEPDIPPVEPGAGAGAEAGAEAAAEEAAVAGAEAAEATVPGIGEILMGITAIGGAIYAGIEGKKEGETHPSIPPPPPMPKMPQMANVAFASAPVIDSSSYHNL